MPQNTNTLNFSIIIPAYNEEKFIGLCLDSLLSQTLLPSTIIVVDDGSTDETFQVIDCYAKKSSRIVAIKKDSNKNHEPGAKVINAFKRGLDSVPEETDIICKFDADLIFPLNYLENLNKSFIANPELGLSGGICTILKNKNWHIENLTNLDHVRGALKAYRVEAFHDIGGLQAQMGWDTADEFKLRVKNWKVKVIQNLQVKHLKPTSSSYNKAYFQKQGEVFYALRYGLILTLLASLKVSSKKRNLSKSLEVVRSYFKSKKENVNFLLSDDEGKYLRNYRWKQIIKKLMP